MPVCISCVMQPIIIDGSLASRFMGTRLIGTWLNPNFEHFLRLYVRLVDKAISEYNSARELILLELDEPKRPIKELEKGRIIYHPDIISEFENCVNSLNRALNLITNIGHSDKAPFYINKITRKTITQFSNRLDDIRNRIEHIEKFILNGQIKSGETVSLDTSEDASFLSINGISINTVDIFNVLHELHAIGLEMVLYNVPTPEDRQFKRIIKR